jgi:hypothetical protein
LPKWRFSTLHLFVKRREKKTKEKEKAKQPAVKRGLTARYCQETRRGVTPSTTPFCMKERGVGEACFLFVFIWFTPSTLGVHIGWIGTAGA